jgi:hypothetical protein
MCGAANAHGEPAPVYGHGRYAEGFVVSVVAGWGMPCLASAGRVRPPAAAQLDLALRARDSNSARRNPR